MTGAITGFVPDIRMRLGRAAMPLSLALAVGAVFLAPAGPAHSASAAPVAAPAATSAVAPAGATQWDLERLMQALAKVRIGRATFTEKKYIALLERPVESSGELFYTAPDKFEKRTIKPRPENMILDGGTLTLERGRQTMSMELQSTPELAVLIDSIRGTLAGDRKALERSFRLKLEGSAERWTLQLVPIDARVAAAVRHIRIGGSGDNVKSVEVAQTDGDRSVMAIERISAQ